MFSDSLVYNFFKLQITDLPPGRIPVETFIIQANENGYEDAYEVLFLDLTSLQDCDIFFLFLIKKCVAV